MKTKQRLWLLIVPLVAGMAGCIVHDQFTTLTINPDGSGDLLILRSNIRSTEKGSRAESEITEYRASFDAQTQDDFKRIRESGARLETAMWLRKQVPMAHMVRVSIPDATALENFATVRDARGTIIVTPQFTISDTDRRLAFHLTVRPDQIPTTSSNADRLTEFKHSRASGISDFRIAMSTGKIRDARGFNIASDRQSALLDADGISSLLRAGNGNIEIFVQWEASD